MMNNSKLSVLNPLFKTPLRTTLMSVLASVILMGIIAILFIPAENFLETLVMAAFIAALVSYFSASMVFNLRKIIEDQKIKLALEQERAHILSRFTRDAAHEFKTPLTIIGISLYLAEKTPSQEKQQGYLQNIHQQIERVNALLDSILILTRLDSTDKTHYLSEKVKAEHLFSNLPSSNAEGRVQIQVKDAPSLPCVQVNRSDFDLAVKHIVDNALRFSPAASPVSAQIESSPPWVMLRVSDQGAGMSSETIEHMFDRFYRSDESHSTPGLGLGLAIARQVIELHEGKIEVESAPGQGTTISIYLPIHNA